MVFIRIFISSTLRLGESFVDSPAIKHLALPRAKLSFSVCQKNREIQLLSVEWILSMNLLLASGCVDCFFDDTGEVSNISFIPNSTPPNIQCLKAHQVIHHAIPNSLSGVDSLLLLLRPLLVSVASFAAISVIITLSRDEEVRIAEIYTPDSAFCLRSLVLDEIEIYPIPPQSIEVQAPSLWDASNFD